MSKNSFRAGAGLTVGLALAALAWPAAGDDGVTAGAAVQAASASPPVIVGSVDGVSAGGAGTVLAELGDQIAAEVVAAQQARDLEALAAAVDAAKLQALAAAVDAAKLEALAAAVDAENLTRLAAAIEATEAREAEERRAAASAPAGSLEEIIVRHFGSAAPAAIRIAECESSLNPGAVSATDDHGLFQINIVHRGQFEAVTGAPWSSVYDPELNTAYARHLYAQQGWSPWSCA